MREYDDGLKDDLDEDELGSLASWALNFVLGLLGATVLGLAFVSLDRNDPRYLYNPWTYAVIVPVTLVMLSAVLSTLVSRIVRRSMQAAFLLSVLAHLLILTYFSNIVIHSRLWPQLFDSFAQQRRKLKLEELQAKNYVKVSATTQPNRRPDHLRYVPTEFQPTEVPPADQRQIQLAKSELHQLVSPKLELEKSTTPHLLKRTESQRTKPSLSLEAAALSRSDLSQLSPEPNAAPTYEIFQSEPQLQAANADSPRSPTRRANDGSALAAPSSLTPEPKRESSSSATAGLQRRAVNDSPSPELMANTNLPRRTSEVRQPARSQPITAPSVSNENPAALPTLAAEGQASRRSKAAASSSRILEPEVSAAALSQLATKSPLQRNQNEFQIPNPSDGATSTSLARSSAGGDTGPASRSSLPVLGSEMLASQANSASELRAGSEVARRSSRGNQAASLPQLAQSGSIGSPQWNGSPSFATGSASRSPAQLALEGSGEANSSDVAAMYGAGGEIQRAAVGLAGPQGRLSVPTLASGLAATEELTALQASGGEVQRGSAGSAAEVVGIPGALSDAVGGTLPGAVGVNQWLPAGMQRKQPGDSTEIEFGPSGPAKNLERRQDVAGGAPKASKVDVPNIDLTSIGEAAGNPVVGSLGDIQRSRRDGSSSRLQIPLEIDANPGRGGLGLVAATEASPILPRRSAEQIQLSLPEFDLQKFARSDVGGPLGGGTNVALPTPAFQQRLDRLENRGLDASIDPRTELAIERGLEFLAKYQRNDGSWRLQDFDTQVLIRSDTAATALALLAFQGAGYTHVQSKYATQVSRAIEFLANHQRPNGDLYIPQDPASDQNGWLYSHAIAALALCEAYGMTQDERLKPIAQRAIDFMVSSQDPRRGGWRYRPGTGSDTSVTGWYMMALQSGRLAGLNVPSTTFDGIKSFVERAQYSENEPHIYRYNPFAPDTPEQRHGLQPTAVMTSVGLLIRLYSGWRRENKAMMDGATYLLIHSPQNGTKQQSRRDTYYWYYATQVIFHMGGDYWKRWQATLNPMLINEQVLDGRYAGSWDPNEPVPDLWARYGGRLYVTTMNLLSLEVSYRHLPLYESTSQ